MSNVRPFMRRALASERSGRVAGSAIQACHGHPGLPVQWRSAHGSSCANQAAPALLGPLGSLATKAPLTPAARAAVRIERAVVGGVVSSGLVCVGAVCSY